VEVLLQLAALTGDETYRSRAARVLRRLGPALEKHPYGFARMLGALDFYLAAPKEIAIIGDPGDPRTQELRAVVYEQYLPNKAVALAAEAVTEAHPVTLLHGRTKRDGLTTVYVCENFACKEPVTSPDALRAQLAGGSPS
jgi:uncharacterized protein YyaL (SSP411 family)